jgi:hypothetical protein
MHSSLNEDISIFCYLFRTNQDGREIVGFDANYMELHCVLCKLIVSLVGLFSGLVPFHVMK